jgi:hypothetical protein
MRTSAVLLLAGWVILEACNADTGNLGEPPNDGMLVVSTFTAGGDPDRDGFQLTIDGVNSVTLEPTDTAQLIIPAGRHALGLLGVAGQCSVDPGTPLDVDIAPHATTPVSFAVSCTLSPPRASGTVLITAPTTGSLASRSHYIVRYTHLGAWDYARALGSLSDGSWPVLGSLDPNGTLVTDLEASAESGADPYWYDFELTDVPSRCRVQDPIPNPGPDHFAIPAGDTLHIEFTVTCAP